MKTEIKLNETLYLANMCLDGVTVIQATPLERLCDDVWAVYFDEIFYAGYGAMTTEELSLFGDYESAQKDVNKYQEICTLSMRLQDPDRDIGAKSIFDWGHELWGFTSTRKRFFRKSKEET
jgi:hypothetical protein